MPASGHVWGAFDSLGVVKRVTGYAELAGQRIAYEVVGEGPVDFVANTGWLSPLDVEWDDPHSRAFFEQWARFARIIRFDRRGVGASDPIPPDALPPWESLSDEIESVMDAVDSDQAVLVAGGTAAPASALFAASRPERALGLVLFQATVRLLEDDDYPFGLSKADHAQMIGRLDREWGTGRFTASLFPSRAEDPEFIEYLAKQERATSSPTLIRRYLEADASSDARAVLPLIKVPTLVLHRTDSPALPIEHGRYVAEHIPNSRLVELPGGDIAPMYESPELAIAAIEEFASEIRPLARKHERQLATVLFTDIAASTQVAEKLGDRRWRGLLERHDQVSRQTVGDHLGNWITSTGDGALATFPGPGRAIRSATSLRRRVRDIGLSIRTGIHTGEIEIRGDDVGGIAVHLAARIMSTADPGEILVSNTVKDLVIGSEIEFEDRGTHRLKGIEGQWRLYSVASDTS